MGWRTVVITGRAKLDLKMNYMVVRKESTTKINIGELETVVIETLQVSITTALLIELSKQKVKVIFCDESYSPFCEIMSYYNKHNSSLMIKKQINWKENSKLEAWTEIIRQKIYNQMKNLEDNGLEESKMLNAYLGEIEQGDITNREGHAAKVYFNALFGKNFTRGSTNNINSALNYGYSILLSSFNREVCSCGYLTQLGIAHDNQFNLYNLSCDLMEPFRPFVDSLIIKMELNKFEREEKLQILNILSFPIKVDGKTFELSNAIGVYTKSVFEAIETGEFYKIKKCEK